MAKLKVDTFLDLVRRSELVDRDQLNRVLLALKEEARGEPINDTEFVASRLVDAGLVTRWQADRLLEGRYKGFFLEKYKLLGHLGTGGMSSVYLAEHVLMHRRVAIKVLPKGRVHSSSYLARFRREAEAIAALDHRNVVRAYDIGNVNDIHYLVMEYVEGQDLQNLVKEKGVLDYARAADFIRQAAEGLEHAHRAGLIHRDIKPANLLLDRHNVVKVLDLGLARFTGEDQASLTVAFDENVLGTADYLAPEQAIDSHGVDARADIYSLGCSLYYLLTGNPPFPDGTLPQRLMMHQKSPPPDIRDRRPDAPEDLIEICLKMMAKKPSARYQSAQEVADVMADWLRAHGHSFDSGVSSGGSSGRLPAIGGGRSKGAPGAGSDSSAGQRLASGVRAALLVATADSGVIGAAQADAASAPGAAAASGGPAAGGGSSPAVPQRKGDSDRQLASRSALRTAKPLGSPAQSADPLAELFGEIASAPATPAAPLRPSSGGETPAYRARHKGTPPWIWAAIAGGCVLTLLLIILAILLAL
jgi:serine/threonine protein kinase